MKFFVCLLLTALLSFALCLYLPWWSIAPAAFLVALLIHQSGGAAFLSAFLGVFLLWFVISLILSLPNEHLLARKVALMVIKIDNPFLLMIVTGVIGGLVAGLASLTGSLLRRR